VLAAAQLLQGDFLGKIELSEDERREIIAGLADTAVKHHEMIRQFLQERQNFVDAHSD
jgi:hypothetical protein